MSNNINKGKKEIPHIWKKCIGAGRAYEGLRADWQEQLVMLQKEIGFEFIRFHGLFHDDMHVLTQEGDEYIMQFQYVDKLFDFLLDNNIKPFVEFGFMPKCLRKTEKTQFWWNGNIAPPKDMKVWAELIEGITKHWINRYGLEEVKTWYFEIWNEPNLSCFWDGTRSEYFEMYKESVNVLKGICNDFKVGGPSTSNFVPDERFSFERSVPVVDTLAHEIDDVEYHGVWIEDFLEYCEKENLPVDFISTHPYPSNFAIYDDGNGDCVTRKKEALIEDLNWLQDALQKSAFANAEIHLTEWSSTPSSRDYSHDYLPVASYIVKSNLEVSELCDSLSYWVFTDIFEEMGAGPKPFHGGFGMINQQGIKKPAYHAYKMLSDLGKIVVCSGDKFIITETQENEIYGLLYNYPDSFTKTVPYCQYPNYHKAKEIQDYEDETKVEIEIENLIPFDRYQLNILDKDSVAIDLWEEMGCPTNLSKAQEIELKKKGDFLKVEFIEVDKKGKLNIEKTLKAWTVISISKCK